MTALFGEAESPPHKLHLWFTQRLVMRRLPEDFHERHNEVTMWVGLALLSALFQVLRNMSMKHLGRRWTIPSMYGAVLHFCYLRRGFCSMEGNSTTAPRILALRRPLWRGPDRGHAQPGQGPAALRYLHRHRAVEAEPLVLVVVAFFSLGECLLPWPSGCPGQFGGVYLLNIQKSRLSVWAPLRELFIDPGLRYTLLSAVLYAPRW